MFRLEKMHWQPTGSDKAKMAPITLRSNLLNRLLGFQNLALIAIQLLSMHTTACALERNWSKWGLMFVNNRAKLSLQRARHMLVSSENHVYTGFSEVELLDLPLENDD